MVAGSTRSGVPATASVPARGDAAPAAHTGDAAAVEAAPASVLDGPFTTRQLLRIDEALVAADAETGLTFSVYVGALAEPTRQDAERLHDQLTEPDSAVLLAVSPNQRVLEIVTGQRASRRLPRQACALAALSMTAAFGGGDLAGGLVTGLRMLTDQAGG